MDFMKLLTSLEELLYEVLVWLLFYPRTFWRSVRHPARMMDYAGVELADSPGEQYLDTINPPVFLMLTLIVAHIVEMIVLPETRQFRGATVLDDETNLLVFRTISFAIFPLLLANRYLKAAGLPLDRHSLRAPFFSQCYVAAPFALVASIALILARVKSQAAQSCGAGLIGISLLWLFWIETRWFQRRLSLALTRAATSVAWAILQAISVLVALLIVFSGV